jgi:hypothetical protein
MRKNGNSVFPRQRRESDVLGTRIDLIVTSGGLWVARRDAPAVLQRALGIGYRQAHAAVSSYGLEEWTAPNSGLGSPFSLVSSLQERVRVHRERREESRRENGALGGRPRALDVALGSTGLVRQPMVETVVSDEPETGALLRVSGAG